MAHGDIWNLYEGIFKDDPLLLLDCSQQKYADGLLKHLLLSRTMNAFAPTLVDILNPDDRRKFLARRRYVPRCPPNEVINSYKTKKRAREELTDAERDLLEPVTMVSRAKYTEERKAIYRLHAEAVKSLQDTPSPIHKRLRIAAIGYRVGVSVLGNKCHLDEELCMLPSDAQISSAHSRNGEIAIGCTMPASNEAVADWERAIRSHLDVAFRENCHFVVLPEFGLPPFAEGGKSMEDALQARSGEPSANDHFMFAGSRHQDGTNRGLVVSKQNNQIPKEPWWHFKVAPARGVGENILGPYGTKRPSYTAKFKIDGQEPNFPIDIAICYDAFDPTMFLTLILQSIVSTDSEVRPRIMLVPSFNRSIDFVALLRDLSFLSRSIVVYVNGLHGDAKMFICGFAVADFFDKKRTDQIRELLLTQARQLRTKRQNMQRDPKLPPDNYGFYVKYRACENLERTLRDLQERQALDAIITVEDRPGASVSGRYDASDLLYYNVDMQLFEALVDFRTEYFRGDLFLPKPFQYEALRRAAVEMRDKIEEMQREEEIEEAAAAAEAAAR